jgi:hypothetical protein
MLKRNALPIVLIRDFFELCEGIRNKCLIPFLAIQKINIETLYKWLIFGAKTTKN